MNLDTEYALQRYSSMGARELCAGNKSGYKEPKKQELLKRNSFPSVNENRHLNKLYPSSK